LRNPKIRVRGKKQHDLSEMRFNWFAVVFLLASNESAPFRCVPTRFPYLNLPNLAWKARLIHRLEWSDPERALVL